MAELKLALKVDDLDNVATISSYKKWGDPEIGDSNVLFSGFDAGRYPFPMTVTFGLNVQF